MSDYSEAPVSFNVKAISADGFDVMLTIRDSHPTELMPRALKALEWLKDAGFRPTNGAAPKAPVAPPPAAAIPNGAPAPPPAAPIPNEIGRTNGTNTITGEPSTNGETFGGAIISTLTVGNSKSGKLQLQFATTDGTVYRCTLPLPAMVEMLPAGWTADHLTPGTQYQVQFRIHWRIAGQYKNIFQVDQL